MRSLADLAVKRPVTTLMLLLSMTVLGAVALYRLPLAFMPDIREPQIFVRVPYPSASPEQIERMILRPVEEALGTVRGIKHMWAFADREGGMVGLNFDWTVDMRHARVEVWERMDRARSELPDDIGDITVSPNWNAREVETPILEGRLSSPLNLSESYDLLERRIVRPLQRVPGVAQVRLDGVQPKEVRVNLRVADLAHHGVDVRDVERILQRSNFDESLGKITTGDRRLAVRTVATFQSIEQIAALPIREEGLRLSDIADVTFEEPELEYGRHLDGNFAVGISVSAEAQANIVEVGEALEARIEEMKADPELEGVTFLVWFSQAKEIKNTLADLAWTGIIGALLATAILFGFLRRWSSTMVAVLCVPFSLLVTCGMVWVQGKSLNTLTLLGLIVGVGMLVDNAVVVMENIFRHAEMGEDRKTASLVGTKQVAVAVIAATMTSVIVFLPLIFSKPSQLNLILQELAVTISVTLLASLFISQTLIPMASSNFIRRAPRPRGKLMLWLEARYQRILEANLKHWWLTPIIGLAVFGSGYWPWTQVDMNFDAGQTDMFAQIHYQISEPLSLELKEKVVDQVEAALEPHYDELLARSVYSFWAPDIALTRVYLKEGEANEDSLKLVRERLRELLPEIAGVKLEVTAERDFWRPDRGKRVAFQLVGEDTEVLAELAREARSRVEGVEGLVDSFSSIEEGGHEIHVQLDRALMSRYDVPPGQPGQVVGLTFRGRRLPRYRAYGEEREMRLALGEQKRESVAQLENLNLLSEDGEAVPLASVSKVALVKGPKRIQRDARMTSVWVGARYEEGTKEEHTERVKEAMSTMKFPYGYSWTFGRWQTERKEKSEEFLVNLLLALLLIFGLMAGLFESVLQAIGLMIALPFALSGAIWALYLYDTDFDQPAAIGLLLLIGIVVNNGIVMVEHINTYRREGMERMQAMLRGGRERLRPILMTAATTLLGLLPMVIQKPALGGVYYYSIAVVLMGGLVVSTFLTTVLLPTTICLVEDVYGAIVRFGKWTISFARRRESEA
ncbi:MAG: efflux RND transporter permease subunit [Deltaproteobacteria bacterium]